MALRIKTDCRSARFTVATVWSAVAVVLLVCWLLLQAAPALGCFGPKLYIGSPATPQGDLLFELVALYVKEKTGTESLRVVMKEGDEPLAMLRGEKVDLAFAAAASGPEPALLQLSGWPMLLAGKRPLEDLQFTTVAPALRKLNKLLLSEELEPLIQKIGQGAPPAATARKYLMAKGWI